MIREFFLEYNNMKALMSFGAYLRLRAAIAFRRAGLAGVYLQPLRARIFLRTSTPVDYQVLRYVFMDRFHLAFSSLPANPVIVDLGSNIGLTCAHYAALWSGARVFGYEMDEGNFEVARKNAAAFPGVKISNVAIGTKSGLAYYDPHASSDAFQLTSTRMGSAKEVRVLGIRDLLDKLKADKVDFMKMDIEGTELDIFREEDLGWLSKIDRMHIEIHDDAALHEIAGRLDKNGFLVEKDKRHWCALIARRATA